MENCKLEEEIKSFLPGDNLLTRRTHSLRQSDAHVNGEGKFFLILLFSLN